MPARWSRLYKYVQLRWGVAQRSTFNAYRRFRGGQRISSAPPVYLEALNFIHFGRWIILNQHPYREWRSPGLPRFPGQPEEETGRGIMLFTSNFDFDWRPYVDAFTETATDDLGVFWDATPGWQRPTKYGYRSFFEFVDRHSVDHDHYYAAFPDLATAEIKSALFVDRSVRSFAGRTAEFSDPDWTSEFDRVIGLLQRDLGTIRTPSEPVSPFAYAPGGHGNLGLTVVAPLRADWVEAVRETIRELPSLTDSPFTLLPGTHFGRLTVVHEVAKGPSTVTLSSGYILLSVDADRPRGGEIDWIKRLYQEWSEYILESGERLIDAVWGRCWGFDTGLGEDDFVTYMSGLSFTATVPFADYPHTSLWDIHRAVDTHDWFTKLVFEVPVEDARSAFDVCIAGAVGLDPP